MRTLVLAASAAVLLSEPALAFGGLGCSLIGALVADPDCQPPPAPTPRYWTKPNRYTAQEFEIDKYACTKETYSTQNYYTLPVNRYADFFDTCMKAHGWTLKQ